MNNLLHGILTDIKAKLEGYTECQQCHMRNEHIFNLIKSVKSMNQYSEMINKTQTGNTMVYVSVMSYVRKSTLELSS